MQICSITRDLDKRPGTTLMIVVASSSRLWMTSREENRFMIAMARSATVGFS